MRRDFRCVSGEGIIGAVTIALEHKLIDGVDDEVLIDTPAGLFRHAAVGLRQACPLSAARRRIALTSVAVTGVPSFVHAAGCAARDWHAQGAGGHRVRRRVLRHRRQRSDRHSHRHGEWRGSSSAWGVKSRTRLNRRCMYSHPIDAQAERAFTARSSRERRAAPADLRSATVLDGEVLRRSPGVTGTAALMAVLDAMGLLDGRSAIHARGRSWDDASWRRVVSRDRIGDVDTVIAAD